MRLLEKLLQSLWPRYPMRRDEVEVDLEAADSPDTDPSGSKSSYGTPEYWNGRWREVLSAEKDTAHDRVRLPLSPCVQFLHSFKRSSWRRILVVGCGISTEPALLAAFGYEVLAIDFSEDAIDHIANNPAQAEELAEWQGIYDAKTYTYLKISVEESQKRIDLSKSARAKALEVSMDDLFGSLETRCIDFKTFTTDEPFDVIYCPWIWQILVESDRRLLPQCAHKWLGPGGACLVTTQNLTRPARVELNEVFADAGFFQRDEESSEYSYSANRAAKYSEERFSEIARQEEARARKRIDAGEKMFYEFGASG